MGFFALNQLGVQVHRKLVRSIEYNLSDVEVQNYLMSNIPWPLEFEALINPHTHKSNTCVFCELTCTSMSGSCGPHIKFDNFHFIIIIKIHKILLVSSAIHQNNRQSLEHKVLTKTYYTF